MIEPSRVDTHSIHFVNAMFVPSPNIVESERTFLLSAAIMVCCFLCRFIRSRWPSVFIAKHLMFVLPKRIYANGNHFIKIGHFSAIQFSVTWHQNNAYSYNVGIQCECFWKWNPILLLCQMMLCLYDSNSSSPTPCNAYTAEVMKFCEQTTHTHSFCEICRWTNCDFYILLNRLFVPAAKWKIKLICSKISRASAFIDISLQINKQN